MYMDADGYWEEWRWIGGAWEDDWMDVYGCEWMLGACWVDWRRIGCTWTRMDIGRSGGGLEEHGKMTGWMYMDVNGCWEHVGWIGGGLDVHGRGWILGGVEVDWRSMGR